MVPAGTRVVAYVVGGRSTWMPFALGAEQLQGAVVDALAPFGTANEIKITRGWLPFSSDYSATVQYTTFYPHASWEDIRATIAGAFEQVMGSRPSVTIPGAGDQAAPQPDGSFNWLPIAVVGGIAVVGLVVLLPYTRRAA